MSWLSILGYALVYSIIIIVSIFSKDSVIELRLPNCIRVAQGLPISLGSSL